MVAVYYSLKELGGLALSKESSWFFLTCLRTHICNTVAGGVSTFMKECLRLFSQEGRDLSRGLLLTFPSGNRSFLFAKISLIVADEAAIKQLWECKGSSGTLPCLFCRNVVEKEASEAAVALGGRAVTIACHDSSRFQRHTDQSLRANCDFLREQILVLGKDAFARLQQTLGLNYVPHGAMFSDEVWQLTPPISSTMFDWLHCYLVNGAFQLEVSLMCESFPLRQCDWQEAMQGYTWPARISSKGASGSAVFAKMRDWEFRCAASEGLSCYRPLRMFVSELDLGQKCGRRTIDIGKAKAARQSFLALCQVLDALQAPSADLATLIPQHLRLFKLAHGESKCLPKHHMAMHLPEQLARHSLLVSCWTHERKHKEVKRFATQLHNQPRSTEHAIIRDVSLCHFQDLEGYSCNTHCAGSRAMPAPDVLRLAFAGQIGVQDVPGLTYTTAAFLCSGESCSRGDVAIAAVQGQEQVAQVWAHMEWDGAMYTCISVWPKVEHARGNRFEVSDAPMFIRLRDLRRTVIYKREANGTALVVP